MNNTEISHLRHSNQLVSARRSQDDSFGEVIDINQESVLFLSSQIA
jgi:hypothetical protein